MFDGRACAIGRDGEGIRRQEVVVCWSAEDGEKLWERRFTPHNTFVPWQRLGWASVAGDAETGTLYAHTSDGLLIALDKDGGTVWQWRMGEDFGRTSGYGGRTHTPIVDEDRVILAAINSSWGDMGGPPSMRYWSFDKKTGEVLFAAKPSPRTRDANTQSTPVIAVVGGERLLPSDQPLGGGRRRSGRDHGVERHRDVGHLVPVEERHEGREQAACGADLGPGRTRGARRPVEAAEQLERPVDQEHGGHLVILPRTARRTSSGMRREAAP